MADEVRDELSAIAREARTLLERERSKGRKRLASMLRTTEIEAGTGGRYNPEGDSAARAERGRGPEPEGFVPTPGPRSIPEPASAEALTLPGFEAPAPKRAGMPAPKRSAASAPAFAGMALPESKPLAPSPDLPQDLDAVRALVAACRKCGLCETRTQTVFADGDPAARLLFVGEAPGRDEDAQGVPFVGRAGQLLNKMIAAIEMKREEVFICNVLKCRPPNNRVPAADEVASCRPYLEQQVALVRPAVICALGLSAAQALLETKASMASLRGKTYAYRGVPLIATYHPAALLRNPSLKREAWIDLQRVRDLARSEGAA